MVATMREVEAHAGVALATVSRVIHNHASVRPTTRTKVHEAIAALHYVPDQVAGSLRSRQTGTLGLLLPTIANAFWMTIARGLTAFAQADPAEGDPGVAVRMTFHARGRKTRIDSPDQDLVATYILVTPAADPL